MKLIAGDFGVINASIVKSYSGTMKHLSIHDGIVFDTKYYPHQIGQVEQVADESVMTIAGALGWGAVGTVIAGPVGAIVGGIVGGKRQQVTVVVTLMNRRRFLAVCSMDEFRLLFGAGLVNPTAPPPAKAVRENIVPISMAPSPQTQIQQSQFQQPRPYRQGGLLCAIPSLFVPGLGQLMQGRAVAAITHFLLAVVLWLVLLGWAVHIWSAIDAGRSRPTIYH